MEEVGRPQVKDEAMETNIKEALSFLKDTCPDDSKLVEKRLRQTVIVGGCFYEGHIIIHDYERESIVGEYHIHIDLIRRLSIPDLAGRLSLAARFIESGKGVRPDASWVYPGKEIENLMTSEGSLCRV